MSSTQPSTSENSDNTTTGQRGWQEILLNRKMLICILLGFMSGLPLYVSIQLVPAWLRSEGVDLSTIGLFALVQIPYAYKFLWSPLLDRYPIPKLGRRRGWMVVTQLLLFLSIGSLGHFNPESNLQAAVWLVFIVALFSASQDIVIDAYRRDLLDDDELGTGNSIAVNAYRLSSLIPGSLALVLSDHMPWSAVYWFVGSFMLLGMFITLFVPEVNNEQPAPRTIKSAVIEPFREFFHRESVRSGLLVLLFLVLYKLGDNMATALSTPFYLDLGFSRTEIGTIAKFSALWSTIAGSIIAGIVMLKISINRALWVFGFVQMFSILGFAALAHIGHNPYALFAAVSFEYLGVGLGTVAVTAFIAKQAARQFSATQIALLTSLTAVPRIFANASTGFLIEAMGYFSFFLLCTAIAIPGLLLLTVVAPWSERSPPSRS
ncbi:MAG: AmpG family muropeptide MFS transporter [Xanthomonadales bacterium]|nr:AmpG family muropeptide MFS transporter [Xanthomonadales bacterium]